MHIQVKEIIYYLQYLNDGLWFEIKELEIDQCLTPNVTMDGNRRSSRQNSNRCIRA
jgi:hypothetical protein